MTNPPTIEEIRNSIKQLRRGKAAGPDKINAELLQGAGAPAEMMTVALVQNIWKNCKLPQAMKHANIILIPKTSPPTNTPAE